MSQWKPNKSIIFQRSNVLKSELNSRTDISWEAALGEPAECVSVESNDPLYILYTSGTTGNYYFSLVLLMHYVNYLLFCYNCYI